MKNELDQCWELTDKQERGSCAIRFMEQHGDQIPLIDKNTPWHFTYGLFLGILSFYWHIIPIGIILLIPLNLLFHMVYRNTTFSDTIQLTNNRNAWLDILYSIFGFLFAWVLFAII